LFVVVKLKGVIVRKNSKDEAIKLIMAAKKKKGRTKVSFTFDFDVYNKFKTACAKEGVAQSRMLETLMQHYLDLSKK
jgi:hypothetical protein